MVDAYGDVGWRIRGTVFLLGEASPDAFNVRGKENDATPSFMTWAVCSRMERCVHAITSVLPAPIGVHRIWPESAELILQNL